VPKPSSGEVVEMPPSKGVSSLPQSVPQGIGFGTRTGATSCCFQCSFRRDYTALGTRHWGYSETGYWEALKGCRLE
jgi:hypothetical protein